MPYEWMDPAAPAAGARPLAELHLWPYRSLPRRGFVLFIGATAGLLLLPLLAALGSPVLWGLLPFLLAALGAVWWALGRSYRDGEILEILCAWPDRLTLTRQDPDGSRQHWEANPYWTSIILHRHGGPVPDYLTLRGGPREVEIGAFLSPAERRALQTEITRLLDRLRG